MSTLEDLAATASDERLKRLLSYVAADPRNAALRADAAEQALDAGSPDVTRELLRTVDCELSDRELNLLGVAEMQLKSFGDAALAFQALLGRGVEDAAVRFNLAWSLAMEKKFEQSLELLSSDVTGALPQAAML